MIFVSCFRHTFLTGISHGLTARAVAESIVPFRRASKKGLSRADALPRTHDHKDTNMEENRLGIVGIIVEDIESSAALNAILHQYADIIVGRLGIPYRDRGVSIISLAVDGSNEAISAMTGKIGQLEHVSVKSVITKM